MTNHWVDIKNTDLAIIMGGNAAEAHPCGFKWVTEAIEHRKAKLIVVDPRFTRSAAIADVYAPIRVGTDIAFLSGVINYLLSNNKIHQEYVKAYTNASFLIKDEFAFNEGYFSGYAPDKRTYEKSSWGYQMGPDGYAMVDETLENPRCVYQLMKTHFSRYTPEVVSNICGTPKEAFAKVCELIGSTAVPDRVMTILYALGWTQHSVGAQNIRTMAMIQLLLGNMGRAGGGVNALRGHANVQGITDMCAYSEVLPGYLSAPTDADETREKYTAARTPKALRPNQMNFPQNFAKWHVSLQKAWYGDHATKENDFAYDLTPKRDGAYDALAIFERMYQGRMNGFVTQGMNPLAALPNKKKLTAALSKLKFLVVIDPLRTETGEFWKNYGESNNVKPEDIKTEVILLPANCIAEEAGSFTSSGRVAQWHWAAADPPGEAKIDREIMGSLFVKLREMYAKDGGKVPGSPHEDHVELFESESAQRACKACQVACMQWNDLRDDIGTNVGVYRQPDRSHRSVVDGHAVCRNRPRRRLDLIRKDGCMHCEDPGCLKACPAPGAIVKYANGIVDFISENCIGCGYCIAGCPFDIPRISKKDNKAYKCSLCSDRVSVGQAPACVKTCPTGALQFGSKVDMVARGEKRVHDLQERGFQKAALYDPQGVGGTHVMYVLQHGDKPQFYRISQPTRPSALGEHVERRHEADGRARARRAALGTFFHYIMRRSQERKDKRTRGGKPWRSS